MTLRSHFLRAACAAAVLLVAACAMIPQIHHGQLAALDKGMPSAEAAARLKQPPLAVHKAAAGGRQFEFHRYLLNNGMQADDYLLAYEKDRLLFWGYVSEFRRHPDAALNAAVSTAVAEFKPLR